MRSLTRLFLACVMGAMLTACMLGCSTLGLQKPTGAEDTLRYGQAVVTGAYQTVGNAAADKSLPATDARKYFNQISTLEIDLDTVDGVVRTLPPGGKLPADAQSKLTLAITALNLLASELRARLPAAKTAALPAAR